MSELKKMIDKSEYAVFFGGAGVSTASGIPDFRGKNGIYNTKNEWGLPPESIISHTFFEKRTKDFFKYYRENMVYPEKEPCACHYALSALEKLGKIKSVITQNIDDLHKKAGSKRVFELHGSVYRNFCTKCGKFYPLDEILKTAGVPKCLCGGIVKPDVVLYEEPLDERVWQGAVNEIMTADLLIVGGSSLTVNPASYLVALFRGRLVIINDSPTPYDDKAELLIGGDINSVFEKLLKEYLGDDARI